MAQQVKFYSVASLPASTNAGGVYFIDGGELYKGSQRFGLGRVTVDNKFVPSTSSKDGQARGDIVVTGSGAGWVFDGTNWQSLGGDVSSLQSMWQADISTWTAGLVKGGTGSYITGITKDADGKVTASASNFATDVYTAVGNNTVGSTSNDVTVSVTTTSGKVTKVEVTAPAAQTWTSVSVGDANSYIYHVEQDKNGQVSASAKAFPTLATGTASGTVKLGTGADVSVKGWGDLVASVSANTTAIEGLSTELESAEGRITEIESIVDVGNGGTVSASSGVFTNLTVTDTATFSVTNVSASSLTVNGSTIEQLADKQIAAIAESTVTSTATGITVGVTTKGGSVTAVSLNAESFTNVMHFLGVGEVRKAAGSSAIIVTPPEGKTPKVGDIVIDKNSGLEAICTNVTEGDNPAYAWELIGDNALYALNAYSSSATVYTNVTTVPGALDAAGAAIDAINTSIATINTSIATKASVGTGTAQGAHGISGEVVLAAAAKPTLTISVDAITASTGVSSGEGKVVTAGAVADYVTSKVAYAPAEETVTANATTLDGAMHKVATAVDALNTKVSTLEGAVTGGNDANGNAGVNVSVTTAKTTAVPTVKVTVTKATLNETLGTKNVADKTIATSIGATGVDTALATEKAVRDAINDALVWLDADGAPLT